MAAVVEATFHPTEAGKDGEAGEAGEGGLAEVSILSDLTENEEDYIGN